MIGSHSIPVLMAMLVVVSMAQGAILAVAKLPTSTRVVLVIGFAATLFALGEQVGMDRRCAPTLNPTSANFGPDDWGYPAREDAGAWVVWVDGEPVGILPEDTTVFEMPPLEPEWRVYVARLETARHRGMVEVHLAHEPSPDIGLVDVDGVRRGLLGMSERWLARDRPRPRFTIRFQGAQGHADLVYSAHDAVTQ